MSLISRIVIGAFAGIGVGATLIKILDLTDVHIFQTKIDVDITKDSDKNISSIKEIVVDVKEEDIRKINEEDIDDIDNALHMQQLSKIITDFLINNKNLSIEEIHSKCIDEYNKVFKQYKTDKVYGDEENKVIDDYLIFLQNFKDRRIKAWT